MNWVFFTRILSINSLFFTASHASSPEQIRGTKLVTLTNLINNGNFSQGQIGWQNYCQGASQAQFDDHRLSLVSHPGGRAWVPQFIWADYSDDDKIFYSVRVKKEGGIGMRVVAHRSGGGYDHLIMSAAQFNALSAGVFVRYSGIRNFVESQGIYTGISIGGASTGLTYAAVVDDVVVINLTADFGAGNEPTVAEMDAILAQFPDGYFEGSTEAVY